MSVVRADEGPGRTHLPSSTAGTGRDHSTRLGRPSWGSWVNYALGSENKDLPEFVVMLSGTRDGGSPPHPRMWNNGYLAGRYQGCPFRGGKEPVFFVPNPQGIDARAR